MFILDLNQRNKTRLQLEQRQTIGLIRQALSQLLVENSQLYPRDRFILAVETDNRPMVAQLMLACWELPICLFPIASELPESYKLTLLQQTATKILISDWQTSIAEDIQIIRFKQLFSTPKPPASHNLQQSGSILESCYSDNPLKLIIATSGTTQAPKAVYLSQDNILAHCAASQQRIPFQSHHCWLNLLPLNHVGGAMIIYRAIFAEASVVMAHDSQAEQIFHLLSEHKITHLSLIPLLLERLLKLEKTPPASLQSVLIGGSALRADLYHRAHRQSWPICVGYGSSESCSHIATGCEYIPDYSSGLTGLPLKNAEIAIDTSQQDDGQGIIKIKGPMVMSGYANPQYQLGQGLSQGWFMSGDRGFWDKSGRLVVLGRADQIIDSGGEKIAPQLIEQELKRCHGIDESVVVPISHPSWGQRIGLAYSGDWEENQVQQWCVTHLKKQFKPYRIARFHQLPKNPMGKVLRADIIACLEDKQNFS